MRIIKGNEQDCICHKPNGKHRKHCDNYRLSVVLVKASGILYRQKVEANKTNGLERGAE